MHLNTAWQRFEPINKAKRCGGQGWGEENISISHHIQKRPPEFYAWIQPNFSASFIKVYLLRLDLPWGGWQNWRAPATPTVLPLSSILLRDSCFLTRLLCNIGFFPPTSASFGCYQWRAHPDRWCVLMLGQINSESCEDKQIEMRVAWS